MFRIRYNFIDLEYVPKRHCWKALIYVRYPWIQRVRGRHQSGDAHVFGTGDRWTVHYRGSSWRAPRRLHSHLNTIAAQRALREMRMFREQISAKDAYIKILKEKTS